MAERIDDEGRFTRFDGQATVLLIESDALMLTAMGSLLDMRGHKAVLARSEAIAIESILKGEFDVIVLSIDEFEQGCAFAGRLRKPEKTKDIPVIFIVPELQPSWAAKLSKLGGVFSMVKPIEPNDLVELVEKVLWIPHVANSRLGASNTHLAHQKDWVSLRGH